MFFPDEPVPLEVVREVASLLKANNLGEISLETTNAYPTIRLHIERETFVSSPAPFPVASTATGEVVVHAEDGEPETPMTAERVEVVAPCVGVFRSGKKPVAQGDEVVAKQIICVVESMRLPNEVFAPVDGRVVELLVVEGQGVEWGQPLLVLQPSS